MPRKERNRLLGVRIDCLEDSYHRFNGIMEEERGCGLWAVTLDITGLDAADMENNTGELALFSEFCHARNIPGMIRLDIGTAAVLEPGQWGLIVRGFEVKDMVADFDLEGPPRGVIPRLRDLERPVTDRITRGRRLEGSMNTFYRHNSFLLTMVPQGSGPGINTIGEVAEVLGRFGADMLRLDPGNLKRNDVIAIRRELIPVFGKRGIKLEILGDAKETQSIKVDSITV